MRKRGKERERLPDSWVSDSKRWEAKYHLYFRLGFHEWMNDKPIKRRYQGDNVRMKGCSEEDMEDNKWYPNGWRGGKRKEGIKEGGKESISGGSSSVWTKIDSNTTGFLVHRSATSQVNYCVYTVLWEDNSHIQSHDSWVATILVLRQRWWCCCCCLNAISRFWDRSNYIQTADTRISGKNLLHFYKPGDLWGKYYTDIRKIIM